MDIHFAMQGADAVLRELQAAGRGIDAKRARAMYRIGTTVKDRAQTYAPISPTQSQLRAEQRGTAKQKAAGRRRRKASATSSAKPGSLQHSIRFVSSADRAEIFVPSNSPAGKYAYRMHEEKGRTWSRRGIGTQAKGPQADEKFIERAVRDSEAEIGAILADELGRGLPG